MKIDHPRLVDLLQRAYSAEKAAAFAYIGHAQSVKNPQEKKSIKQMKRMNGIIEVQCSRS